MNGDGKADIVGFGFDRVLVALSTGSGFAPMTQWTTDFSYNAQQWRVEYHPRLLADVNGDGLEDVYIGGGKGQAGQLYIQTGFGMKVYQSFSPFQFRKYGSPFCFIQRIIVMSGSDR